MESPNVFITGQNRCIEIKVENMNKILMICY